MRLLLTLPPLSMTPEEAKRYSGHSPRHLLPTLARLFRFTLPEREEIARWAPSADRASGAKRALPNIYSQEAAEATVLPIVERLLTIFVERVAALGGPQALPRSKGWEELALCSSDVLASLDSDVGAEASSSDSDEED